MSDPHDDGGLADHPIYRAGLLMGRNQAVTDIMERLLSDQTSDPGERLKSIFEWSVQALEEGRSELKIVVGDIQKGDY
ncbi:hypothetical protein [Brevundimonas sp. GCM10030266]|uniref:hypothetical protein n=1 Tax=Brevundimonas sp. GCM10030266 TaxID=3273386 RepID=UPI0036151065